jgi:hypothetical protein
MKLKEIFRMGDDKPAKKRKALKKVLEKLKKKRDEIEAAMKAGVPEKKLKKLKTRLKANRRHRRKARKLIAELE